jgi:hypothetical protein
VERARHELIDDRDECPGSVGHYLSWLPMATERRGEEAPRGLHVASS